MGFAGGRGTNDGDRQLCIALDTATRNMKVVIGFSSDSGRLCAIGFNKMEAYVSMVFVLRTPGAARVVKWICTAPGGVCAAQWGPRSACWRAHSSALPVIAQC